MYKKKEYVPTAAPTIEPTPTAPIYDTTKWDDTGKGAAAGNAYKTAYTSRWGQFECRGNSEPI